MPLSPPHPRHHYHTRRIHCEGYLREDGLWDIEARLEDTKSYAFDNNERGSVAPGEPLHGMELRLTLDDDMVIRGAEAVIDHSPFEMCTDITSHYRSLLGLTIKPGFTLRLKERVGGTRGCTHLTELIGVMATVAFQTIHGSADRAVAEGRKAPAQDEGRPTHLGGCHALASHSPVVALHWPEHFAGDGLEN